MKGTVEISRILAVLIASGLAQAQSVAVQPAREALGVAAARCAYTNTEPLCSSQTEGSPAAAQFPRRAPGPPAYPPPPPQYRIHNARGPALKGALIGGLIGFGFGAAGGKHRGAQDRLGLGALVGFIGAGLGAAIGADHAFSPYHYRYRYAPWPDESEEDEMSSRQPTRPRSATQAHSRSSSHGSISSEINQNSLPPGTASRLPASDKLASRTGLLP